LAPEGNVHKGVLNALRPVAFNREYFAALRAATRYREFGIYVHRYIFINGPHN